MNYKDGRQEEYVIGLSNKGYGKIDIRNVKKPATFASEANTLPAFACYSTGDFGF